MRHVVSRKKLVGKVRPILHKLYCPVVSAVGSKERAGCFGRRDRKGMQRRAVKSDREKVIDSLKHEPLEFKPTSLKTIGPGQF